MATTPGLRMMHPLMRLEGVVEGVVEEGVLIQLIVLNFLHLCSDMIVLS